jgi:hypothetical protein
MINMMDLQFAVLQYFTFPLLTYLSSACSMDPQYPVRQGDQPEETVWVGYLLKGSANSGSPLDLGSHHPADMS